MMNILLMEDEQPAAEKLIKGIGEFDKTITVHGPLRSVKESVRWLTTHPSPDLIVADIQLSDGISLDVFRTVNPSCPIIFATAYDEYLMEAFGHNSIDYLLKPVKQEKLEHALTKYLRLKQHFSANVAQFAVKYDAGDKKQRIVVKKGLDFLSIKTEDIAYFFTEHKLSFLVDKGGKRYIVDKPLSDLETDLDRKGFFRVNRKYLVRIAAVLRFSSHEKGKLTLELSPRPAEEVIVSQEKASEFKKWMGT
ncbi:MAG: response regulator transcription factor [Bacteroidetes bacterium]|nr:response regulator transcription factor [Bacteroidota bacterium]